MKAYLPDHTRLSQVHLRTTNIDTMLRFYASVLGLTPSQASDSQNILSATSEGPGLIVISEDRNAVPRPLRSTGLYHFALRFPTRNDFARGYRRLVDAGYPIAGASDHGVSEAIYLADPDGNGVELYSDRPRSQWQWRNNQVIMRTSPLDVENLLSSTVSEPIPTEVPSGLDLGHIHLHVADLPTAEKFYSDFLGLAITQRSYPGALFFAADNYHHHVAVNTWSGKNAPPGNSVGLISYRFEVPIQEILYCLRHRAPVLRYETRLLSSPEDRPILQIRDPNGNWLEVQGSTNPAAAGSYDISGGCSPHTVSEPDLVRSED